MAENSNESGTGKSTPKTIMVVDADILARMAVADYLRECGYKVIEAVSGAEVHQVLAAGNPVDVLLIDVLLHASEDGFALGRAIRSERPEIQVIMTTSAGKLADKAGELCDDGPLVKPFHPQELMRRIQRLRAGPQAETPS
jgi:DNA-binding response OmpR family regulator